MVNRVADLRRNYTQRELLEASAGNDPFRLFREWFEAAIAGQLPEPNAMTLATASPDGAPSARMVLLKDFDERGFVFYTNFESRKGRELTANPRAALVFWWAEHERQVRVEGCVERVSDAEADAYFRSRPVGSQLGAAASRQSAELPDREPLEARLRELQAAHPNGLDRRPEGWGGYRVVPSALEFWQGRPSRLHDRLLFRRAGDAAWQRVRLSP